MTDVGVANPTRRERHSCVANWLSLPLVGEREQHLHEGESVTHAVMDLRDEGSSSMVSVDADDAPWRAPKIQWPIHPFRDELLELRVIAVQRESFAMEVRIEREVGLRLEAGARTAKRRIAYSLAKSSMSKQPRFENFPESFVREVAIEDQDAHDVDCVLRLLHSEPCCIDCVQWTRAPPHAPRFLACIVPAARTEVPYSTRMRRPFLSPAPLRPGGHIRVIAPSSPFDSDAFERGVSRLRERYRVTFSNDIHARSGFLAGDDARRRKELEDAIDDPSVEVIVAARGGYGAMRAAERLDPLRITNHPKWLVGLSDITALHALWARAGVASVHASMMSALSSLSEDAFARWCAALEGVAPPPLEGLHVLKRAGGTVMGTLLGGNLSILAAMIGTPLAPCLDGAILFLEDVGEAPYRVDRMLTQLKLSGALAGIAGILLGTFTRCDSAHDEISVLTVLEERLTPLNVPILAGIPSGHNPEPLELRFGAPAKIDADRGVVTFPR